MKKQILYITEHLCSLLNEEQLKSIQKASALANYTVDSKPRSLKIIKKIHQPNVVLASEQCLLHLLEQENFHAKSNFILFGGHKDDLQLDKYKNNVKDIRFILGDLTNALLELILAHTLNYFQNQEQKNICHSFDQEDSISFSCELTNSKERDEMQGKISEFFRTQIEKNKSNLTIGASTYAKNLADILEEFLMNAIWDANPKYAQVDRTKPIELLDNEKVNIFCLFDGVNLILSVTDLFGTFASSAIQKHILFSLGFKGENTINEEQSSGAGIGLFMILQKIGVLVFEVEKGKATRATAIARGDQPLRDMQKKTRTLLFYEKE